MTTLQAVLTALILGTGGVAGGYTLTRIFTKVGSENQSLKPWSPKSLKNSSNFFNTYSQEGLSGKEYSRYLVSAESDNEQWWQESFSRHQLADNFSKDFPKSLVTLAFSDTNSQALNKVCEAIYKKQVSEITWDYKPWKANAKRRNDFWKYCSIFKEKVLTIIEDDFDNSGDIGSIGGQLKKQVLSTKLGSNNEVWRIKQEEVRDEAYTNSFFSEVKNSSDVNALRNKCREAYRLSFSTTSSSNSDNLNRDTVLKYCSLDKK